MRRELIVVCAVVSVACEAGIATEDSAVPVPAPGKADTVDSGLPMITEYVEPSSGNDKAIELYNPLPFAVSMDACSVRVFSNGRTTSRNIALTGLVMQPGGTAVVCHSKATNIDNCDVSSGNLGFNGNDAVALTCDFGGSDDVTLDVVGVIGENPGSSGWTIRDGHTTKNETLRRSCGVERGEDAFVAAQWEPVGADDFSGLGEHEPCDAPAPACNEGDGVLGASADAIFSGADPRFEVVIEQTLFDEFTPRTQELLLEAGMQFLIDGDQLTDGASALAGVAREGSGFVESYLIHDTASGLDYDAVRFFANDATEHSVVHLAHGGERVAFSFDGELFGCDGVFCNDGELTLPVYQGLDENFEPDDRFEIVEQHTVLAAFDRRARVLRSDAGDALLDTALAAHGGPDLTSPEALEQIARENAGPITYYFIAGPTEDLEGVVYHADGASRGFLAVEDSLDAELLSVDGEVTFCAAPS